MTGHVERILAAGPSSPFEVLELPKANGGIIVDKSTVRAAFKKLAVFVHPDKSQHPQATEAFRILFGACEILSSDSKPSSSGACQSQSSGGSSSSYHGFTSGEPRQTTTASAGSGGRWERWWEKATISEMMSAFDREEQAFLLDVILIIFLYFFNSNISRALTGCINLSISHMKRY